jgi:hypothetical protein
MEIKKPEVDAIEETLATVHELKDLELSMIGGGCGDISLGGPNR